MNDRLRFGLRNKWANLSCGLVGYFWVNLSCGLFTI